MTSATPGRNWPLLRNVFRNRSSGFLLFVGLISIAFVWPGAPPAITHGPILGSVGEDRVGVWIRTSRPSSFEVSYSQVDASADGDEIGSVRGRTELTRDNTGWVLLEDLAPGTRYEYEVRVDEFTPTKGGSFHTLPSAEAHRHPDYNPDGLFNFSFEYGACNFQYEQPDGSREMPAYGTMVRELAGTIDFQIMNGDFIYEVGRRTSVDEWAEAVGAESLPDIVETAPQIVGVWQNYKIYFDRSRWLSEWHRQIPAFFMFDDHELLNDINGTADPGIQNRRTLIRDIGVQAWRDYLGWSNPLPRERRSDVHFGRATLGTDGVLHDSAAHFDFDPADTPTLHVHWNDEHPGRGVYEILEIIDPERLRLSPPPQAGGSALSYSIGMQNYYDFQVGNAHFFVLDTRSHRNEHDRSDPWKEGVSMLGRTQRDWLTAEMTSSDADFFFVVSTVSFSIPHVDPNDPEKDESWTAYLDEREALFEFWDGLEQPVMLLTGDLHNSASIRITDNVHEFLAGHQNSPNHYARHEAHRPPSGSFEHEGRTVDIRWSTYFLDDVPREAARQPYYTVVKVKNVFRNPDENGNDRWIAYPQPQVVFEYHDGRTGELVYAESVTAGQIP